ncbi:MAG TPA: hypothetical protein VF156_14980 [Agromyces sp.]
MTHPTDLQPRRRALGLPVLGLIGLAALGVPRVILHDLGLIEENGLVTWLLALLPIAAWIVVAVAAKVPNPFLTVLVIGTIFGVMLVVTHQLLWVPAFDGNPPALGDGPLASLIPRVAAMTSGLFTGAIMGAIAGLVAWGIRALVNRSASPSGDGAAT